MRELREGVTFHNGAALDANDVVTSYAVQWDAANPLHVGRDGSFTYWTYLTSAGSVAINAWNSRRSAAASLAHPSVSTVYEIDEAEVAFWGRCPDCATTAPRPRPARRAVPPAPAQKRSTSR